MSKPSPLTKWPGWYIVNRQTGKILADSVTGRIYGFATRQDARNSWRFLNANRTALHVVPVRALRVMRSRKH